MGPARIILLDPHPTLQDLVDVLPAPPFDHPPEGALEDVQEVVVDPKADEHLDGELEHLMADWRGRMEVGHASTKNARNP